MNSQVPAAFPWEPTLASLAGAQPKLAGRLIDGKIVAGLSEDERQERWEICEDLARQLVPKTLKDAAKHPEHSHEVTLNRLRLAVEGKKWTERAETEWLMERLRVLLDW